MAKTKAAITQKLSLNATGILDITDDSIYIENVETGESFDLKNLLSEFADKSIKLSITYDYDYDSNENDE